tara:strand:- start:120 stop:632 length:513 start_codon:yes stop_codon:yes gene_type:complete
MKKYTKRKSKNKNKISININFLSNDKGYNDFLNPKLIKFMYNNIKLGNNLIQTQPNKYFNVNKNNRLYLQAISVKKWNLYPEWDEIECEQKSDFIKSSPCNIGNKLKLFVKLKSNEYIGGLGVYIMALHLGIIDKEKHIMFINELFNIMKDKPIIIHNTDVDWFHLKEYK